MGLIDWLFKGSKYQRIPDSFVFEREYLWPRLREAILAQLAEQRSVWVVTHFAETFSEVQEALAKWELDYKIIDRAMTPSETLDVVRQSGSREIVLGLSELLVPIDSGLENSDEIELTMVVLERYPLIEFDERLVKFAQQIPAKVRFGYLLAINDTIFKRIFPDTVFELLKQMGLQDNELITSTMISRRLDATIKRESQKYQGKTKRANSIEEWYKLNDGSTELKTN